MVTRLLVLVMLVAALTAAVEISAESDLQTDLESLELSPAASAETQEDEGEGGVLGRCGEECAGAARQEPAGQVHFPLLRLQRSSDVQCLQSFRSLIAS